MIVSALEREEGEERWRETQKESERGGEMTVSRERSSKPGRGGGICEAASAHMSEAAACTNPQSQINCVYSVITVTSCRFPNYPLSYVESNLP